MNIFIYIYIYICLCVNVHIMYIYICINISSYQGLTYHCDLCPGGTACEVTGLSTYNTQCAPGHWCAIGAINRNALCAGGFCINMYGICPVGYFCPLGTVLPFICPDGLFMTRTGAAVCDACPKGFHCDNKQAFNCPIGSFCPEGTGISPNPCPIGLNFMYLRTYMNVY
jgi:hypothetical protein